MKLTYMGNLKTSSTKLFAIIFSILTIFSSISIKAENDYSHIKTTIYIKDIDRGNNVLDGFKYKVIHEDGTEEAFENIEKGVHEVTLEAGNYIIEESWTLKGYIKSKPLHISLPFVEEDGVKMVKSIYPKHKKKPNKPNDNDKPGDKDKPDDKDKPSDKDKPEDKDRPNDKDEDKPEHNNPWNPNDNPIEWSSNNLTYSNDPKRKNQGNINEDSNEIPSNLGSRDISENFNHPRTSLGSRDRQPSSDKHNSTIDRTYSKTGNGESILSIIVLLSFNLMTLLIGFLIGSRIDFRDKKENKNEKQ